MTDYQVIINNKMDIQTTNDYLKVYNKKGEPFLIKRKTRTKEYLKSYEDLIEKHRLTKDYICFCDGSADNMDKSIPMVSSGIITKQNNIVFQGNKEYKLLEEQTSNNVAEIYGIQLVLTELIELKAQDKNITIFMDSQFVVNYCANLKWNNINLNKPYGNATIEMREYLKKFSSIEVIWIPRELNQEADSLT